MSEPSAKADKVGFGLTEGLLVAGIPAVGYWLAYLYEVGYCTFFEVPISYIQLDLTNVFAGMLGVISVWFFFWLTADMIIFMGWRNLHRIVRNSIARIVMIVMITLIFSVVYSWSKGTTLFAVLSILALLLFLEFGLPMLTQRHSIGFIKKLEAQRKIDLESDTLLDVATKNVSAKTSITIFSLYLISIAAWGAGGIKANRQTEFWTQGEYNSLVIIRHYGDSFFAREYLVCLKSLSPELVVLPAQGQEAISLSRRKLGFLFVSDASELNGDGNCNGGSIQPNLMPY